MEVTIKHKKNWNKSRQYKRSLPQSWQQIESSERLYLYLRLLLSKDRTDALLYILKDMLALPKGLFESLDPVVVNELIKGAEWMKVEADPAPLFDSFEYKEVTYHLPSEKFGNGVAFEYPIADEFYMAFKESGLESDLLLLVGTLCRESKKGKPSGDKRVSLENRAEVYERADALEGLPQEIMIAVLFYFSGIKEYIHSTYSGWIFQKNTDLDGEPVSNDARGPIFGWWSIYFGIAESGVFGTIQQVHQTNFHTLCMYLVDQKAKEKKA